MSQQSDTCLKFDSAVSNLRSASDARGTKAGFARHECGWHERLVNDSQTTSFSQLHWLPLLLRASPTTSIGCLQAAALLGEAASCRLRSCKRLVDVMYIPSRTMYQVDAAGSRVSQWGVSKACALTGRGGILPPQELRTASGCHVPSCGHHESS